jgi:PKD repeat protein
MMLRSGGECSFMVCVALAVLLTASVADGGENFVVAADINGAANYMVSNGDGTFSQPSAQGLESASADGISPVSYGNGIGDFDNDGDLDYIMGRGDWFGAIYLFENIGPDNQFKAPVKIGEWSFGFDLQGLYVMDMAVADFNGDGDLDFVVSFDFNGTCSLYLGNGDLSFAYFQLDGTAPMSSSGADAADFDNDGDADFVVAPGSGVIVSYGDSVFYVNLNNGDGTFETLTFDSYLLSSYGGVAAADFNGDGNVDLAAAASGYLDIYLGDGTGKFTFEPEQRYAGAEHSNSTLDNGDFDGDGNQDLVTAGLGVKVFPGNGDGTFSPPKTSGEGTEQLSSVTAAPFLPNKEPVAAVEAAYPDVSVGETLEFSGSGSSDEDGQILSYEWEFGDGNTGAGEIFEHTYNDVGIYAVTLTVTDDRGATASATTEVTVVEAITIQSVAVVAEMPPIVAKIKFGPGELDLKGKGKGRQKKWIKAKIKLPKGYDAHNIDLSTVCIFPAEEDAPVAFAYIDPKHGLKAKKTKKKYNPKKELTVKFDRQAVKGLINHPSKKMTMMVQGYMSHNGESLEFSGAGKLKIKTKKGK